MFSSYDLEKEEKLEIGGKTLKCVLQGRDELSEFKNYFTLSKLLKCKDMFTSYLDQYGEHEPVQTSNHWLNRTGNWLLSYTYFIHTNQIYASRAKNIIDTAKKRVKEKTDAEAKEHKKDSKEIQKEILKFTAQAVYDALLAIKQIDDEMNQKNINGIVRNSLKTTLKEFGLDLKNEELIQRKAEIELLIKNLPKLYKKRVISPIILGI